MGDDGGVTEDDDDEESDGEIEYPLLGSESEEIVDDVGCDGCSWSDDGIHDLCAEDFDRLWSGKAEEEVEYVRKK